MRAFPISIFTIFLVLASTAFHAAWNLLTHRERCGHTFLLRAVSAVAVIGFVPAIIAYLSMPPWPREVWYCLALTSVFSGAYFFALASAYKAGDFTVAYPVARSLPVILVGIADFLRGNYPTRLGWLGMALVAVACLVTPLHSFKEIKTKLYFGEAAKPCLAPEVPLGWLPRDSGESSCLDYTGRTVIL